MLKITFLLLIISTAPVRALEDINLRFNLEHGFLAVLSHNIQFGQDGTEIDLRNEGGQDILFPFWRVCAEIARYPHGFTFLYQPLALENVEAITRDLVVYDGTFPEDTPVRFNYGFPYYRFGYRYTFTEKNSAFDFGLGFSLQIRNANIVISSLDGTLLSRSSDVGFVPLIAAFSNFRLAPSLRIESQINGIYAPVRYLNISTTDVEGAFLEATIRTVFSYPPLYDYFLSIRYIGGGAEGTSDNDAPGDGFTSNWLNFLTITLGISLNL